MATKVFGQSDDLIEFEGDINDEIGCYATDEDKHGILLMFSDGTILEVKYGKADMGIWELKPVINGPLIDHIDLCNDEDDEIHSDVVHFKDGLKWCYAAMEWELIK